MDNKSSRPSDGNRPVRRAPVGRAGSERPAARPAPRRAVPDRPADRPTGGETAAREPRRPRRIPSESRWFRAILMVITTIGLCVFFAMFILQSANDLFGLNQDDLQIEVTIPKNVTIAEVSELLTNSGVVEQSLTFRVYASLKEEKYLPGDYIFNSNMGYDEILIALRTGDIIKEEVRLTFIEGMNVYEIAQQLEDNKVCDADEFLSSLQTEDFGYEFMDQLPESGLRFRRLEGYIFPDTYDFYVGENVDSVARKFLRNFDSKITSSMRSKMMDLNLSLDEAITLASIIQKEADSETEMRKVSSVFHNRLNLKEQYPKLQSDVTKNYATYFIIPFHTTRNQPMYDAYNTYECDGLPVAPICNPGMDAIEAALYPAETPYYYFVTDVQQHFYYAITLQEHNQNIRLASSVEGEGEIHGTDTVDE